MSTFATLELSKSGPQSLPPHFDPKKKGYLYGQNLPYQVEELDPLAKKLGVTPLSDFFDESQMLDPDELEELGLPPAKPKWFAISKGLATFQALLSELKKRKTPKDELWDLEVAEAILAAADPKEKFRIVVV